MAGKCLTYSQRREIERLYTAGAAPAEIAKAIGVTVATVYRELHRGETGKLDAFYRPEYSADVAECALQSALRNRGRRKLSAGTESGATDRHRPRS